MVNTDNHITYQQAQEYLHNSTPAIHVILHKHLQTSKRCFNKFHVDNAFYGDIG